MISHVNMNFHLQNKYRLQFWMKLYLAAWVARFGNIFLQILEFQSSDGVIQKVTGTLQSDILCFQNSVFPTWRLTVTLGLTRRTPILWFQLTDWPRQAKRQRYQYSLITWGAQLGCFLVPNCFVSLPFGLIFAPLGASSLFSSLCGCCGQRGQPTS